MARLGFDSPSREEVVQARKSVNRSTQDLGLGILSRTASTVGKAWARTPELLGRVPQLWAYRLHSPQHNAKMPSVYRGFWGKSVVHPSETDQKKGESALRLAQSVMAGEIATPTEREGVRVIHQAQRRLTKDEVEQIGAQYCGGRSTYELTKEWGVNRETISLALRRAGVPTRHPRLTDEQLKEALRLHRDGWSLNRLGQKFGLDPKTMKKRLALARDSK